ncbi:MAG: acyl carrier protein [Planctomycetes bacterium]|nr:acyl carrier protein [Planctomycetota bacterium]
MTGVAGLEPERDFYDAGVTSVQALPLLLELEARFAVAIPDEQFIQSRTTRALESMIRQLRQA